MQEQRLSWSAHNRCYWSVRRRRKKGGLPARRCASAAVARDARAPRSPTRQPCPICRGRVEKEIGALAGVDGTAGVAGGPTSRPIRRDAGRYQSRSARLLMPSICRRAITKSPGARTNNVDSRVARSLPTTVAWFMVRVVRDRSTRRVCSASMPVRRNSQPRPHGMGRRVDVYGPGRGDARIRDRLIARKRARRLFVGGAPPADPVTGAYGCHERLSWFGAAPSGWRLSNGRWYAPLPTHRVGPQVRRYLSSLPLPPTDIRVQDRRVLAIGRCQGA
jgi:hypothetical protein